MTKNKFLVLIGVVLTLFAMWQVEFHRPAWLGFKQVELGYQIGLTNKQGLSTYEDVQWQYHALGPINCTSAKEGMDITNCASYGGIGYRYNGFFWELVSEEKAVQLLNKPEAFTYASTWKPRTLGLYPWEYHQYQQRVKAYVTFLKEYQPQGPGAEIEVHSNWLLAQAINKTLDDVGFRKNLPPYKPLPIGKGK